MTGVDVEPVQVGARTEDLCRACKSVRSHTVSAVDGRGRPVRVVCDTCNSHHNWRGGGGRTGRAAAPSRPAIGAAATPVVLVPGQERRPPAMSTPESPSSPEGLENVVRRVLREELGLTPVAPASRWQGGTVVLRPGREGLQEKEIPIDTLFNKVVMVRNRLRSLEQQVNASDLPAPAKLKLQGYITACYGSLTTFNILFEDPDDRFSGTGKTGRPE